MEASSEPAPGPRETPRKSLLAAVEVTDSEDLRLMPKSGVRWLPPPLPTPRPPPLAVTEGLRDPGALREDPGGDPTPLNREPSSADVSDRSPAPPAPPLPPLCSSLYKVLTMVGTSGRENCYTVVDMLDANLLLSNPLQMMENHLRLDVNRKKS